ncbi:MAG: MarR family transcriptional regulator [Lachnospiraceae bacterium]|nr:MarR family transcriptional regulator [Lachnospiraceae bacterium]
MEDKKQEFRGETSLAGQEISGVGLEQFYDYIEEVKELISSDLWENIFLNCTKNEVLILWLLYRKGEVNMSQIAEYIHVPLNTATGIISRMEKNEMVGRMRSKEDKRIVLISFTEKGRLQFQKLMDELLSYGVKVLGSLTKEEMELLQGMMTKVKKVLKEEKEQKEQKETKTKVRKIMIE